ncbi:unnamed protein product [Adineta steineri]|uniref:Uncharacterized protein n=1 Tax=Adineta steineri TaxID=433720 RepID=A0A815CSR7_9BILA|nr:unnamed protein product [Adineta steineri]
MSSRTKPQKKRKRHSSSPSHKSQIARRLEKLRAEKRDLWNDDDEDDDDEQSKTKNKKKVCIVLSDSDEEQRPSSSSSSSLTSQRQLRSSKSRKKTQRNHNEPVTCLICSILSQLSSVNCCSAHISLLKNHTHHHRQKSSHSHQLSEQVMIIPMTDEIVQRYFDPQQNHHLRKETSTNNETSASNRSTRKALNKSTTTSNRSKIQQPTKSATKSSQTKIRPIASSIVIGSKRPLSQINQSNESTTAVISSSSITVTKNIEKHQIQQSPIETIVIDESQNDNQEINTVMESTDNNKSINPWTSITDEIDTALERVLDQVEATVDSPLEFTPTTVRRTETEIMAARLPKIPLKEGRFRNGKPILNRSTSSAANEYRPLAATRSLPLTSTIFNTNVRSPSTANNVEQETSHQNLNNSENTPIDHNNISTTAQADETVNTDANENSNTEIEINLSNITSVTPKETITPSRLSFRLNPDGSRVGISRPPLPTNRQSPSISFLRRTSTDVTPIQPNTKQV